MKPTWSTEGTMVATDYRTFINTKRQENTMSGFEPLWLPDWLKDFQTHMTDWAIRKGRAAIFADCLGAETIVNTNVAMAESMEFQHDEECEMLF